MTDWEKEFNELLDSQRGKTWLVIRPLLKVFISNLLSQQKAEAGLEAIEMIAGIEGWEESEVHFKELWRKKLLEKETKKSPTE